MFSQSTILKLLLQNLLTNLILRNKIKNISNYRNKNMNELRLQAQPSSVAKTNLVQNQVATVVFYVACPPATQKIMYFILDSIFVFCRVQT